MITPPLDGTILPGLTRASCLELTASHSSKKTILPGLPDTLCLHIHEQPITMAQLVAWSKEGKLLEAFGVGTAVIVAPVGRIGFEGQDVLVKEHEGGLGPVGKALWKRIVEIQEGRVPWGNWSVVCEAD